jgi:hypothetical protein
MVRYRIPASVSIREIGEIRIDPSRLLQAAQNAFRFALARSRR